MGSDGLDKSGGLIPRLIKKVKAAGKGAKAAMLVGVALLSLLLMHFVLEDHDILFVLAEGVHGMGIAALCYRLNKAGTCAGLSRTSQELTAVFLAVRLYCSAVMEGDIHTVLDLITLAATLYVIYVMRFKLASSYSRELDSIPHLVVVVPCLVLAMIAHPHTVHWIANRVLWAFAVYLEAVSVAPQVRMMQRAQVVEKFTAFYVFALGVSRFLSCAHWLLQVLDPQSFLRTALGTGLWPVAVLLSEIVQTFILADFCYYYIKMAAAGESVMRLPIGVV
jgi:hypothetical protein